jgi:hypothetical protein
MIESKGTRISVGPFTFRATELSTVLTNQQITHPASYKINYVFGSPTHLVVPGAAVRLPTSGDVSQAGDLGYNMGPWRLSDNTPQNRPSLYGYFTSVWRRGADGRWRVALDFGTGEVDAPAPEHKLGNPFTPARDGLAGAGRR